MRTTTAVEIATHPEGYGIHSLVEARQWLTDNEDWVTFQWEREELDAQIEASEANMRYHRDVVGPAEDSHMGRWYD